MEIQSETRSFRRGDAVMVMFATAARAHVYVRLYVYSLGRVTPTVEICTGRSRKREHCSVIGFFLSLGG